MDVDEEVRPRPPGQRARSASQGSASRGRDRSASLGVSPKRSASPQKTRAREEDTDAEPAKRARTRPTRTEDAARGRRMFGNILGTLRKFNDESASSKKSAAAQRREETAARIAAKLRDEADAQRALVDSERELRALRVAGDNAAYLLDHREIAMAARHRGLRVAAKYLSTSSTGADRADTSALYPVSPAPLAQRRGDTGVASLYFLPKVLLPHQETALRAREEDVARTISDEADALERDRAAAQDTAKENVRKMADLEDKVRRLRETAGAGAGGRERGERQRRGSVRGDAKDDPRPDARDDAHPTGRSRSDSVSRPAEPRPRHADDEMEVEY